MSLTVSQGGGGDFEILPEGVYTARCYRVIDLGTQDVEWQGTMGKKRKMMVSWEILDDEVKMDDGRPFAISQQYTASLNENSNLYKHLVAWRGKPFTAEELMNFDMANLVGAYCTIQVIHNKSGDKTYANVNTIMNTKERPEPVNEDQVFDVDNPDMGMFEGFSDWLKDKIRNSDEWSEDPSPSSDQAEEPKKGDKLDDKAYKNVFGVDAEDITNEGDTPQF